MIFEITMIKLGLMCYFCYYAIFLRLCWLIIFEEEELEEWEYTEI